MDQVHPVFVVSDERLMTTFERYIEQRRRGRSVTFDGGQVLYVPVQGHEPLELHIAFQPPLEQAKRLGYEAGEVWDDRTPADHADYIRRVVRTRFVRARQMIIYRLAFNITHEVRRNENATLPQITFRLNNKDGRNLSPSLFPSFQIPHPNDVFSPDVLIYELGFPLFVDNTPQITNRMNTLTLGVQIDEAGNRLEFALPNA